MNNTSQEVTPVDESKFHFVEHEPFYVPLITTLYALQFLACIIGNCLELIILPRLKSPEDYIIYALCTLSCSDLLQAFTLMPLNYHREVLHNWVMGLFLCKFLYYFALVNGVTNVWISVYIAFDRYISICHPYQFINLKTTKFCIIVLLSLFIGHSIIFSYSYRQMDTFDRNDVEYCRPISSRGFFLLHRIVVNLIYSYALPVICLILFYGAIIKALLNVMSFNSFMSNSEDDTSHLSDILIVKIVLFMILFFIISNMLLFIARMWDFVQYFSSDSSVSLIHKVFISFACYLHTIHNCLNPWLYCFYSKKYLMEIKQLFICKRKKQRFTQSSLFQNSSKSSTTLRRMTLMTIYPDDLD